MDVSQCSQFGCGQNQLEYEVINQAGHIIARYCAGHGLPIFLSGVQGHTVMKSGYEEETMAQAANSQMAPPDAVFDEDDVPGPGPAPAPAPVLSTPAVSSPGVNSAPTPEEASTNFFWRITGSQNTFDMQTTVRGAPSRAQMAAHLDAVISTLMEVIAHKGIAKIQTAPSAGAQPVAAPPPVTPPVTPNGSVPAPVATAPVPTPIAGPVPIGRPATLPEGVPPPPPGSPAIGTKPIQVAHSTKIKIIPQADKKVEIEFYSTGKYADFRLKRDIPIALEVMKPLGAWTEEHMKQVGEYAVNAKIYWQESEDDKRTAKGNLYKNVISVTQ